MKSETRQRLEDWLLVQKELREHTESILEAVERAEMDAWLKPERHKGLLDRRRDAS